jgi:acetyl-CoA C-acetyltransferase
MQDVFVVSAVRTAIGKFNGSLAGVSVVDLGKVVMEAAVERAGIDKAWIDEVIMGCVLQAGHDLDPARVSAIRAGIPQEVPALTINKACGSGLKSVALATQAIKCEDASIVLAGGMENMNRVPYALLDARQGYRMGSGQVVDLLVNGLTCPMENVHMGVTAEEVAKRHGLTREDQDRYAADSYAKALAAVREGRFKREIVPVLVPQRRGDPISFEVDEDVVETPFEALAKLRPAFVKANGTVTAGNASGINDGAAATIVAGEKAIQQHNLTALARIAGFASAGLEPIVMGLGPARAIPRALAKAGWKYEDVDLWELNEAFAAQSLGVLRERPEIDPAKVNVNGGAVALGHPVGASGTRVLTTLIHALQDRNLKRGVAALCIGGGMGIALAVEIA